MLCAFHLAEELRFFQTEGGEPYGEFLISLLLVPFLLLQVVLSAGG